MRVEGVPWKTKQLKKLKKLLDEGKTYSQIGKALGKTKGAIASAVRRYYYRKPDPRRVETCEDAARAAEVAERLAPLLHGALSAREFIETPPAAGIKYPDPRFLSDGYCRAILGDARDMVCCGERTRDGRVYCDAHHEKYNETPRGAATLARLAKVFR